MSFEKRFKRTALFLFGWLSTATGCTFSAPNGYEPLEQQTHDALNVSPMLPLAESVREVVQDVPGKMTLMYGHSCAFPERAAGEHHVGFRVQESVAMPAGYEGTVFLNGFRGDYDHGDRNMLGIGASLIHVESNADKGELKWQASGVLGDNSGDDSYKWCYWYGVVLWNKAAGAFDIAAFQTDADPLLTTFIHHDDYVPGSKDAVRDLPGKYTDAQRRTPKAVIPRGFGLLYTDDDHNLLQEGFDLGLPQTTGTMIEWNAQTVLKDNADYQDYRGSALVSFLMGQSVNVWQPEKVLKRDATSSSAPWEQVPGNDFHLVERVHTTGCITDELDYRKWDYVIENVPFQYALPVLNGWDNGNTCGDSNVQSTGVWLTAVTFEKQANGFGKLSYTVASKFSDDGGYFGDDGNQTGHSVVVLGFNELKNDPKGGMTPGGGVAPLPTKAHL